MEEKPLRVLIVSDSEDDVLLLIDELMQAGYTPHHERVDTTSAMLSALQAHSWDLILSSCRFRNFNCLQALELLKQEGIDTPFIIVSPVISEEMAIEALNAGAHDCVKNRRRLIPTIERELRTAAMRREHKQTEEELQRDREIIQQLAAETSIIADIGRLIGSTLDIDEVYERFAAEAGKLIPLDRLVVNLNKPQEGTLSCTYVFGLTVPGRKPGDSFPLARSINEVLLRTRKGVIIQPESIEEIADRYPSLVSTFEAGMHSMVSVPLISRDEVIGGLHFRSKKPNAYTERDLRLAERIGDQIAGAIANAQLFADLKRAEEEHRKNRETVERLAKEMAVIAEIGRLIGSTLDIDEVYERFAAEARKLIPFDNMLVNLIKSQESALEIAYVSGMDIPARRKGDHIPFRGSVCEVIERNRKGILFMSETGEEMIRTFPTLAHVQRAGLCSTMLVPLISADRVIGTLAFRSKQEDAYTDEDLDLAERIGDQIAGAIANAQLFADLKKAEEEHRKNREKAERLAEEMAVIAEIGRLIGSTLDIDEVYERFAAETRKLIPFDRLSVSLNNPREQTQRVAYVSGFDIPARRRGDTFSLEGTVNEVIVRTRTGLLIPTADIEDLAGRLPGLITVTQEKMRSVMSVPLISHDEVIGALHFRAKKPDTYTPEDLRLAERIGEQIAGAIASAQLYIHLKKTEIRFGKAKDGFGHCSSR